MQRKRLERLQRLERRGRKRARDSLKPLYPGMVVPPGFGGPLPPGPKLKRVVLKAKFPGSRVSPPPDTLSLDSGYDSFDTYVTSLDGEDGVDKDFEDIKMGVKHGVSGVEHHVEDDDEGDDAIILAPDQPTKRIKFRNADAQAT